MIGRVSRLSRLVDRRLADNFARFGIESWMYDVLATLRRSGPPYELTAGELVRQAMVTTGAITNRIDRLEERGLVERAAADRSPQGDRAAHAGRLTLVDEVVFAHVETERETSTCSPQPPADVSWPSSLRTTLLFAGRRCPGVAARATIGAMDAIEYEEIRQLLGRYNLAIDLGDAAGLGGDVRARRACSAAPASPRATRSAAPSPAPTR